MSTPATVLRDLDRRVDRMMEKRIAMIRDIAAAGASSGVVLELADHAKSDLHDMQQEIKRLQLKIKLTTLQSIEQRQKDEEAKRIADKARWRGTIGQRY
jgi:hypothetical protein